LTLHYTPNRISNAFEGSVVRELARLNDESDVEGFIAHNVLIPHVKNRYLPNEHDVVLLLPHVGYTLDAKEYRPGEYRIPVNGLIEFRPRGDKQFVVVRELPNPYELADKKSKILNGVCRRISPQFGNYWIESLIVVPDHVDLLCDSVDDADQLRINLRIVKLRELCRLVIDDMRGKNRGKSLELPQLKQIWEAIGAQKPTTGSYTEVCGIQFGDMISRTEPGCPLPMEAFRGVYKLTGRPVEIRLYRSWPWNDQTDRFLERMRRRLTLLQDLNMESVPRVIVAADLPDVFIFATRWFEGETLTDLVQRRASLPADLAVSLVRHVGNSVLRLHEKGIVHLDIRPEHVWVGPSLESHSGEQHLLSGFTNPLIDDARLSTQAYAIGFDASFSAPEMQYHRHPDRGKPQNDVFSLGRLLAYCILGEELYRRNLQDNGSLLLPDEVSGSLRHCIHMSTAPRVSVRLASINEFVRLLGT
jgi:hypothetical protein